jgi:diaminopimelate epimerase
MNIPFQKYEGTGNDFILLDNRDQKYTGLKNSQVEFLCNRNFGIGADGLILLEKKNGYDFKMIYFNSDGNISSMCGNGGRCITAFAKSLNLINGEAKFVAADGDHKSEIISKSPLIVKLKMADVSDVEQIENDIFLNTGSPHYVRFVNDVLAMDIVSEARKIRYNDRFKTEGTNVNFVQQSPQGLIVRSYERGVENETLSCGTGVTASVLASVIKGIAKKDAGNIQVKSMGGILTVHYKPSETGFENVWLEGEAKFVFKGEIEIQ